MVVVTYSEIPIHNADIERPYQNKHFKFFLITCFVCDPFTAGVDHPWDYQHILSALYLITTVNALLKCTNAKDFY